MDGIKLISTWPPFNASATVDACTIQDEVDKFFDASSSDENEAPKARSDNDEDSVDNEDEEAAVEEQIPRDRLREIGDTFELPKSSLIRPKQEVRCKRV